LRRREDYIRVAPNPGDFPTLAAKMKALDTEPFAWSPAEIRAIVAPTLVVIGDADIVPPEYAVELFELRGGGGSPATSSVCRPLASPSSPAPPTSG
jgi:pimeloyl-ACP methyl ester carboxylesterase